MFERAHLNSLGDSALGFEVVYRMTDPDFKLFMDTQQSIYLDILKRFSEEGIAFAHPARTVFIEDGRQQVSYKVRYPVEPFLYPRRPGKRIRKITDSLLFQRLPFR